jgi:hypothetical protein
MEYKKLTAEQVAMLNEPLPAKALKQHPTKAFLTTINSIYVTERLNKVFGVGAWRVKPELQEADGKMVVVKTTLTIPEYGIEYECYGGNDNADRGDAYKGAVTDAITKIGSWLGIGAEVWKNEAGKQTAPRQQPAQAQPQEPQPTQAQSSKKQLALEQVKANEEQFILWLYNAYKINPNMSVMEKIAEYYDCDFATKSYICDKFEQYLTKK